MRSDKPAAAKTRLASTATGGYQHLNLARITSTMRIGAVCNNQSDFPSRDSDTKTNLVQKPVVTKAAIEELLIKKNLRYQSS